MWESGDSRVKGQTKGLILAMLESVEGALKMLSVLITRPRPFESQSAVTTAATVQVFINSSGMVYVL